MRDAAYTSQRGCDDVLDPQKKESVYQYEVSTMLLDVRSSCLSYEHL